jgi:glutathione S-transferase
VQLIRTPASVQQPDLIRQSVDETEHLLTLLEAQLGEHEFIAGEQFSMADIPVACEIHRWFGLPRTRVQHRHIERWYQGLQQRRASQGVLDVALS